MGLSLCQSLFATIAYADIFDYPLTGDEVAYWCIGRSFIHITPIPGIEKKGEYFHLSHRESLVSTRKKRFAWSARKWKVAHAVAKLLARIPTIELVGVTGALAMSNAKKDDDIDFFIITSPGTLWITRLLSVILVDRIGRRRKPGDTEVSDKVCLNMFMSAGSLRVPAKERDLFSAHETIQMKPLWARDGMYARFLEANQWVQTFLPMAARSVKDRAVMHHHVTDIHLVRSVAISFLRLLEPAARRAQLWYMKNRRTNEVITDHMLRFHPRDARGWVKAALANRLATQNIPLDNVFYAS